MLIRTWLKVFQSADRYEARGHFTAFLFRIAYRKGLNLLREERPHKDKAELT